MAGKDNPVKGKKAYHLAHSRNEVITKSQGPTTVYLKPNLQQFI